MISDDSLFSKLKRGFTGEIPVIKAPVEKEYVGRDVFPMSNNTLGEVAASVALMQSLAIRDGETLSVVNRGLPCLAVAKGQCVTSHNDGRSWAQVVGGTMFELPTSLRRENISHVMACTTQRYRGFQHGVRYRDMLCKVFLVPDEYLDSIKEASLQDAGFIVRGKTRYSEPWKVGYDENGNRLDEPLVVDAFDGEPAVSFNVRADNIGFIPGGYKSVMSGLAILGGSPLLDGSFATHLKRCVDRIDLEAAIDKYLSADTSQRLKVKVVAGTLKEPQELINYAL